MYFQLEIFPDCVRENLVRNSLEFPAALSSSLGFKNGMKTGLAKMMIRGESVANVQLAHDSETDAIGEGPLFVGMFAKPSPLL